jgi:hypothetical protein
LGSVHRKQITTNKSSLSRFTTKDVHRKLLTARQIITEQLITKKSASKPNFNSLSAEKVQKLETRGQKNDFKLQTGFLLVGNFRKFENLPD